jgi:hypothetical protein
MKSRTEMSITASCLSPQLWTWIIAVYLLAALAMPICMAAQDAASQNLYARWAGTATGGIQSDCLGRPGLPLRRPGFPPAIMNHPCKPVLGSVQTSQRSSDLAKNDQSGTYITFDVPGAVNGTYPQAINPAGTVTGNYSDADFVTHGFLRSLDGTITTFDIPGAAGYTNPEAINPTGTITGDYADINGVFPGFVRSPDGSITTFDVAGDVFGLFASAINPAGAITGTYFDADIIAHGFLRSPDGTITTFDVPGAANAFASAINPAGAITGSYADANGLSHGFLRSPDGTITTFDVPGASTTRGATLPTAINPVGTITGSYFQPIQGNPFGGNYRGFLRAKDGTFTTFDAVPSPSDPCCTWTSPLAINPAGEIVGYDNDFHDLNHGVLRAKDGSITILDAPGAGTRHFQGTYAVSINPSGQITGYYVDANNVYHGFVWTRH